MQSENNWTAQCFIVTAKLLLILVLFSAARLLFLLCNYGFFCEEPLWDILVSLVVGIRFDITTIATFNAPLVFLWLLPIKIFRSRCFLALGNLAFFLLNFVAMLVNVVDAKYFSFTLKRMSGEILSQFVLLKEDPAIYVDMMMRYWHVALSGLLFIYALYVVAFKFGKGIKVQAIRKRDYCYFLLACGIFVVCVRGGLQRKPLKAVDSNIYAPSSRLAHLANNTAINIFHTRKKANLPSFNYFHASDGNLAVYSPLHKANQNSAWHGAFEGKNVMVIILESFSAEHIAALDSEFKSQPNTPYTPFLDSLINNSCVFDGFANGTISIDGLTAVVFGIPALQDYSYITSAYAGNTVHSVVHILKKHGYKTSFFYGGKPNSCNFGNIMSKAGVDEYYCETDYDGPAANIQGWGVYDEPFFQFVAKKINESSRPFFSVLFTLSSHHPFLYPEELHGQFPKGTGKEPLQELIAYTDYSLKKFFETAKTMDWYKDTIFILVADHTAGAQERYYQNSLGQYSIPMIFFDPSGKLAGKFNYVAQQIDIFPTVLDLLGVDQDYFAFGSSLFDNAAQRFAISYKNGLYQIITNDFVCKFDGKKLTEVYARKDYLLENNLVKKLKKLDKVQRLEVFLKSFLQHYGTSLRNNSMYLK